jgi:hypothetical protein
MTVYGRIDQTQVSPSASQHTPAVSVRCPWRDPASLLYRYRALRLSTWLEGIDMLRPPIRQASETKLSQAAVFITISPTFLAAVLLFSFGGYGIHRLNLSRRWLLLERISRRMVSVCKFDSLRLINGKIFRGTVLRFQQPKKVPGTVGLSKILVIQITLVAFARFSLIEDAT